MGDVRIWFDSPLLCEDSPSCKLLLIDEDGFALWLGVVAKFAEKVFYPFSNIGLSVHLYCCVQSAFP
jgi:hypothetical protein